MRIAIEDLPSKAPKGFYICTAKRYNSWKAVAPIRETAKTLLCCEVCEDKIREEWNCDTARITCVPGDRFAEGAWETVPIYSVRKSKLAKVKLEHTQIVDMGR